MFIFAVIFISLAMLFYTVGVWSERKKGCLELWHLIIFWIGLALDTTGTSIMFKMAGGKVANVHGLTGLLAIIVMGLHVLWATIVLLRDNVEMKIKFHRLSVFAWTVWMMPFLYEMIYNISAKVL